MLDETSEDGQLGNGLLGAAAKRLSSTSVGVARGGSRTQFTDSDGIARLCSFDVGYNVVTVKAPSYAPTMIIVTIDDLRALVGRTVTLGPGSPVGGTSREGRITWSLGMHHHLRSPLRLPSRPQFLPLPT